jgi:hypothetical protein
MGVPAFLLSQGKNTEVNDSTEPASQAPSPEEHIAEMDAVFYTKEADNTWDDIAREQIYANYMSVQPEETKLIISVNAVKLYPKAIFPLCHITDACVLTN